jgi:bacilliredoxin
MSTYPDLMIAPMRRELTEIGFAELRTPQAVDAFISENSEGTALLAVNSICGCAAGTMRPALARALQMAEKPQALGTVFAGKDLEATDRARQHFIGYAPSSPAVALFKDGQLVMMMERHQLKGRHPQMVSDELIAAFEKFCTAGAGL